MPTPLTLNGKGTTLDGRGALDLMLWTAQPLRQEQIDASYHTFSAQRKLV